MDEAFFLRAKRLLERRNEQLDHRTLIERVAAVQASTPTARTAAEPTAPMPPGDDSQALTSLLLAEPGWRRAAQSQHGCFNRAMATRRVNRP